MIYPRVSPTHPTRPDKKLKVLKSRKKDSLHIL